MVERFIAPILKTKFLPCRNFIPSYVSIQSRTKTKVIGFKIGNNLATENGGVVCCQLVAQLSHFPKHPTGVGALKHGWKIAADARRLVKPIE